MAPRNVDFTLDLTAIPARVQRDLRRSGKRFMATLLAKSQSVTHGIADRGIGPTL